MFFDVGVFRVCFVDRAVFCCPNECAVSTKFVGDDFMEYLPTERVSVPSPDGLGTIESVVHKTRVIHLDVGVRGLMCPSCGGEMMFRGYRVWVEDTTRNLLLDNEMAESLSLIFGRVPIVLYDVVESCWCETPKLRDEKIGELMRKYEEKGGDGE